MNVFRFINSKDIRTYLRKTGYCFTALEAAWLIWQSRDTTIREKHQAWNELIETMPDCVIRERPWTRPLESLHAFLEQYMHVENKLIKEFSACAADPGKRYVWLLSRQYETGEIRDSGLVFSSFETLCAHEMDVPKDVVSLHCRRTVLDAENSWDDSIEAELTPDLSFRKIICRPLKDDGDDGIFNGVFEGLWFAFPTPFARGDLLWFPYRKGGFHSGPFVNDGTIYEAVQGEALEWQKRNGDNSDMISYGWQIPNGMIVYDHLDCYMDAEYYPYSDRMDGEMRILKVMSDFLKKRIGMDEWRTEHQRIGKECLQNDFEYREEQFRELMKTVNEG